MLVLKITNRGFSELVLTIFAVLILSIVTSLKLLSNNVLYITYLPLSFLCTLNVVYLFPLIVIVDTKATSSIILLCQLIGIICIALYCFNLIFESLFAFILPLSSTFTSSIFISIADVPKAYIFSITDDNKTVKLLSPKTPPLPFVPCKKTELLLFVLFTTISISSFSVALFQSLATLGAIFSLYISLFGCVIPLLTLNV